jgi:hypothetical protein
MKAAASESSNVTTWAFSLCFPCLLSSKMKEPGRTQQTVACKDLTSSFLLCSLSHPEINHAKQAEGDHAFFN